MISGSVIDRSVRGCELAPLTNDQKATICILAQEGYDRVGRLTGEEFDSWRHAQQEIACGRASLCTATQKDYLALRGHFRALAGHTRSALRDFVASETNDSGYARKKLRHECRAAEDVIADPENYVRSIARNRFKTGDLEALSSKQIWSLVFDIRRNAQRRRRTK